MKRILGRQRIYGELTEEIHAHLEEKVEELVECGMSRRDAEAAARREFGNVTLAELDSRDVWRTRWVENMVEDIRYALRVLRKNPGFAAIAVLTLALGIGANTAIFSVVNAVLVRALPFQDPARLMVLWHTPPQKAFPGVTRFVVSPANYLDWRDQSHAFEQISAIGFRSLNLTGTGAPETVRGRMVAAGFFSLLGVQPVLGRDFLKEEDQPGRGNVAVISHAFWETHFGASKDVLGRQIKLADKDYTIVGVAPAKFDFPYQAQMWVPLAWTEKERAVRGNHNYLVIARLKGDVSMKKAQTEMDTISARLAQQYPVDDTGWGALVKPLDQEMFNDMSSALLVLFGAVGFVLLIACTNVANLTLAKALARRKEIAVRTALGASRGRILGLVLTETVLISIVGGALALLLAHFVIGAIADVIAPQLPMAVNIGLDGWVLGFTLTISIATGVAAGLAPSWHLTKVNLNDSLKQGLGKTDVDAGGGRARSVFVGAEVAVSLVLLVGAGLMIRTLYLLKGADSGIDPRNVLTLPLGISSQKYTTVAQQTGFFNRVLEQVRVLPGVELAGAIDDLPSEGGSTEPVQVEGQPVVPMADQPEVAVRLISPGYLRVMRIPLKLGRDFTDADNADAKPVVLVSESFAKHFWPNENPIGKHVKLTFLEKQGPCEVVGVVGEVKLRGLGETTPAQAVYHAMAQDPEPTYMKLAVRTSLPPLSLASAITEVVHRVDADEPVVDVKTMEQLFDQSISQNRLNMILLSAFAGLALLLASIGIYGVQAYAVRQRTREFGIRVAMGARPVEVFRLIIAQGLRLTAVGIVVGLAASFGLTRLVASQLYGLSPTDPLTFGGVSVVLVAVMLAACLVPARRATRIDPVVALRDE